VLSQRAGERAATYAAGAARAGDGEVLAARACGGVARLAAAWLGNAASRLINAPTAAMLKRRAQAAIGEGLGVVRTAQGISASLDELRALGRMVADLAPGNARDRGAAIDCLSIITTGLLVAAAAAERTESRGGHYREDFPAEDDRWRLHVVIALKPVQDHAAAPEELLLRHVPVGEVTPHRSERI